MGDKMTISNNVMKINEWKGTSVWYRVGCRCSGEECDTTIMFEFDEDFGHIDINFYKKIMWNEYWRNSLFHKRWWARIKAACKILFTGYIDLEGNFMIQEQEHLDEFIEALQEGREKMLEWQEEFQKKLKEKKNEN